MCRIGRRRESAGRSRAYSPGASVADVGRFQGVDRLPFVLGVGLAMDRPVEGALERLAATRRILERAESLERRCVPGSGTTTRAGPARRGASPADSRHPRRYTDRRTSRSHAPAGSVRARLVDEVLDQVVEDDRKAQAPDGDRRRARVRELEMEHEPVGRHRPPVRMTSTGSRPGGTRPDQAAARTRHPAGAGGGRAIAGRRLRAAPSRSTHPPFASRPVRAARSMSPR